MLLRARSNRKSNSIRRTHRSHLTSARVRKLRAESLESRRMMAAYINEVHFNPLFGDTLKHQYVELRGDSLAQMSAGTYLVEINSADGVSELGDIYAIFDLSNQQFGSNGMLVLLESASSFSVDPAARVLKGTDGFAGMPGNIFSADAGFSNKQLRTGSNTFLLIQSNIAPSLSNDIDLNDDGTPDGAYLNWTILDGFTVLPSVESVWPQKGYAPIVFQEKGVGSGMPGATLVTTEALGYVGRIGQSTGYAADDWLAGNTTEDGSATWNFQLEDGIFGVPRPRAYAGRHLDHIGGPNWVGSVSGSVFIDLNSDGIQQPGEAPVVGAKVVSDLTGDNLPDLYSETIEPNRYAVDRDLTNISYNATLTTAGTDNLPINFNVLVVQKFGAPNGQHIFSHAGIGFFNDVRRLRTDFYRPARSVDIDFIGDTAGTVGRLEIFNANNVSLGFVRVTSGGANQVQHLSLTSNNDDIAWAVAYSEGFASGAFDTLSFVLPGQTTVTDAEGKYFMQPMTPGDYSISVVPPVSYDLVYPTAGAHPITVVKYESYSGRNFGFLGNLPPVVNDQLFHVSEANIAGAVVANLQFSKGYPSQVLAGSITSGDPTGLFSFDPNAGTVTLNRGELNFETKNSYRLRIELIDTLNATLSDSATIDLVIDDANESPVAQSASKSLTENSPAGTGVTTMTATDQDAGAAGQVRWSIVAGNTGNAFAIDANTGEVRVNDASKIDFESNPTFNLTVRATDRGTPAMSGDSSLVINLLNENELPVLAPQALFIKENSLTGALLGKILAIDPDSNENLQWKIVGGSGSALFQIAIDGGITVAAGTVLDYEQINKYDLIVTVTDAGGLSDTRIYNVTVQDQNDTPSITSPSSYVLNEDAIAGTIVGTVAAADQDVGQQMTYSISGNAASKFVIDPVSGQIKVASGASFDFESAPSLSLTVVAADNGTPVQSTSKVVALQIADVNELPSILSTDFDVPENSPAGTTLGNVSASDPDAGDKLTFEIIQQSANWLAIESATGALSVAAGAAIDFESLNISNVTVRVTDKAGLKAERNVAIHALDRNDPPSVANTIPNTKATALKLFTYTLPTNIFTDQDAGDSIRLAVTTGAGFPLPSWLTFNASTRVLSGTPTSTDGGNLELKVTAIDSLGASSSLKFTIAVDANLFPWHNPINSLDTNSSGAVSALDALLVINYLNSGAPRLIPQGSTPKLGYLDTNSDNAVSPIDALLVINELSRVARGEGESPQLPQPDLEILATNDGSVWSYMQQLEERKRQDALIELLAGDR